MFRSQVSNEEEFYSAEPDYIKMIRDSCPQHLQKMQMTHKECRILSVLLKMIKANKVLELGALVGCSAAWIARSLTGESPLVISVEKSAANYSLAQDNIRTAGLGHIIQLLHSDATEVLASYRGQVSFDAVLIDAKKTEYIQYLELSKQCIRRGGILIADNTLMIDEKIPQISQSIKRFNEIVESDPELTSAVLPTIAGMTVMVKN